MPGDEHSKGCLEWASGMGLEVIFALDKWLALVPIGSVAVIEIIRKVYYAETVVDQNKLNEISTLLTSTLDTKISDLDIENSRILAIDPVGLAEFKRVQDELDHVSPELIKMLGLPPVSQRPNLVYTYAANKMYVELAKMMLLKLKREDLLRTPNDRIRALVNQMNVEPDPGRRLRLKNEIDTITNSIAENKRIADEELIKRETELEKTAKSSRNLIIGVALAGLGGLLWLLKK